MHLIKPLGFSLEDKFLKRAGLDYFYDAEIHVYDSLNGLFDKNKNGAFYYLSTKAQKCYTEVNYKEGGFLVFGKETKGLDEKLLIENYQNAVRIPMKENNRSLNLSNAVAIVLYEALRQQNFNNLLKSNPNQLTKSGEK